MRGKSGVTFIRRCLRYVCRFKRISTGYVPIHFFIDFSSAQPATVLGDPDFSMTVHDFGKMQNTSPTGLLGEESNIDVF